MINISKTFTIKGIISQFTISLNLSKADTHFLYLLTKEPAKLSVKN